MWNRAGCDLNFGPDTCWIRVRPGCGSGLAPFCLCPQDGSGQCLAPSATCNAYPLWNPPGVTQQLQLTVSSIYQLLSQPEHVWEAAEVWGLCLLISLRCAGVGDSPLALRM